MAKQTPSPIEDTSATKQSTAKADSKVASTSVATTLDTAEGSDTITKLLNIPSYVGNAVKG